MTTIFGTDHSEYEVGTKRGYRNTHARHPFINNHANHRATKEERESERKREVKCLFLKQAGKMMGWKLGILVSGNVHCTSNQSV